MKIRFERTFLKDVEALGSAAVRRRVQEVIVRVESATGLDEIQGIKKIKDGGQYYRIRIGDYRLGIFIEEEIVVFVRCLHRRDIYRRFP